MNRRTEQEIGRDKPPTETVDETRRMRRSTITSPPAQPGHRSASLRRTLGSRGTLRQAIVLQEILGPPAALRRGQGGER